MAPSSLMKILGHVLEPLDTANINYRGGCSPNRHSSHCGPPTTFFLSLIVTMVVTALKTPWAYLVFWSYRLLNLQTANFSGDITTLLCSYSILANRFWPFQRRNAMVITHHLSWPNTLAFQTAHLAITNNQLHLGSQAQTTPPLFHGPIPCPHQLELNEPFVDQF